MNFDMYLCEMCCATIILIAVCSLAINMHLNFNCDDKNNFYKVEQGLFIGAIAVAVILFLLMCYFRSLSLTSVGILVTVIAISSVAINMQLNMKCSNSKPVEDSTSNYEFIGFIVGIIISLMALIYILYKMFHHEKYSHHFTNLHKLITRKND